MCIRDSFHTVDDLSQILETHRRTITIGHNERTVGGGFSKPVSYTHLRAHETVLDLVCRLLLEKKKETI